MTAKELLQKLSDRIMDVDDVVGMPGTPCPAQSQDTINAARILLMDHAEEVGIVVPNEAKSEESAKEIEPGQSPLDAAQGKYALPTVGPAPYIADFVVASTGESLRTLPNEYPTESDAVEAILREAEESELPVDWECVRHWTTFKDEHVVDFGSHSVYGRVRSKPDDGKLTPADLAETVSPGIRSLKPVRHLRSDDGPDGC